MAEILDWFEPTNTTTDKVMRAARTMPDSRLVRTIPLGELVQFAEALPTDGAAADAEGERLKAIADEFRKAIPTPDGAILAAMIEQGVTALESHIRYACGVRVPGSEQQG